MAVSREIQTLLEKERFDSVEDSWLSKATKEPDDLDYFVGVARALVGVGEEERARFLLEMLDDQLREQGRHRLRLELLRRAGSLLFEPDQIHPQILATLADLYGSSPNFDGFVQAVRLDKATHDIPKTWEKVGRFEDLVPFDVGRAVWMEGKGAGRVTEVNLGLDSLKIDFERHPGLTVGFRAAAKLLQPLEPGHVLYRKLEEPEALAALGDEDPSALLAVVLGSYDRPLTAAEIRDALYGVVDEKRWTSWWNAARKHPQVVTSGSGARQRYAWLASEEKANEVVWGRFEKASPHDQIALLKREGSRDPELGERMAAAIGERAETAAGGGDPALAFELAFALERAGVAPPADASWRPERLVASTDPNQLLAGIDDRVAREQAYRLIADHRDDAADVFVARLGREEEPKLLDLLADELARAGRPELPRFLDDTVAKPHRQPAAFTWLAERAAEDPELRSRNPLRLLTQLFAAFLDDRFKPYRTRLAPLVESGGTAPRLLDHLDPAQAEQAETVIGRAAGLEPYQREALATALQLKFPELQRQEAEVVYSTPESIAARREELRRLVQEELPANRKAIEEARALGDLRENFEYKSARQRHEYLSSRQAQLERDLTLARPLDPKAIETSEVRIGTRVALSGPDGGRRIFTILGPWDSDPDNDVIAYESDLARTLLGKKPGETVALGGGEMTVESIEPYA